MCYNKCVVLEYISTFFPLDAVHLGPKKCQTALKHCFFLTSWLEKPGGGTEYHNLTFEGIFQLFSLLFCIAVILGTRWWEWLHVHGGRQWLSCKAYLLTRAKGRKCHLRHRGTKPKAVGAANRTEWQLEVPPASFSEEKSSSWWFSKPNQHNQFSERPCGQCQVQWLPS